MSQEQYAPEDLLAGQVVIDELSVDQMQSIQDFLEKQYSPRIDAIIKDFDDDDSKDSHLSRTYLERRSPLHFHMSVEGKSLLFFIRFNDTDHSSYDDTPATKFNEVVVTFSDGVTSRNAYGTKQYDHIQRKRKIKYIVKLEQTIIEILDTLEEITSKARVTRLENKKNFERMDARQELQSLNAELKDVEAFEEKYSYFLKSDDTVADFDGIKSQLSKKIVAELESLKRRGLD